MFDEQHAQEESRSKAHSTAPLQAMPVSMEHGDLQFRRERAVFSARLEHIARERNRLRERVELLDKKLRREQQRRIELEGILQHEKSRVEAEFKAVKAVKQGLELVREVAGATGKERVSQIDSTLAFHFTVICSNLAQDLEKVIDGQLADGLFTIDKIIASQPMPEHISTSGKKVLKL